MRTAYPPDVFKFSAEADIYPRGADGHRRASRGPCLQAGHPS